MQTMITRLNGIESELTITGGKSMSNDYSENTLIQESAGKLLQDELGWEVEYAYNSEQLGNHGTFGRESYKEILLVRYFRDALKN